MTAPGDASQYRFIPACAGNSSRASRCSRRATVHPRVCGELQRVVEDNESNGGSSPRVRGTLGPVEVLRHLHRFIPACAGNSGADRDAVVGDSVHPRVCGELEGRLVPHADVDRFIPACAGNSQRALQVGNEFAGSSPRVRGTRVSPSRSEAPPPVHPRVCGELAGTDVAWSEWVGSSPRVRGTPAARPRRSGWTAVHPRVCGELVFDLRPALPALRFIPACAGNSAAPAPRAPTSPVHPRVCGELGGRRKWRN